MSKIFITAFQSIFKHPLIFVFSFQEDRLLLSTSEMTEEASGKWEESLFKIQHKKSHTHADTYTHTLQRTSLSVSHVVTLF